MSDSITVPSTVPPAKDKAAYVAAVNKVDQAARNEVDRANGNSTSTTVALTPDERTVLIDRASRDADRHKVHEPARTLANHVAGSLASIEPIGTKPPFKNDDLNKIYSAQHRYATYVAERLTQHDRDR